jgi:hypothetical protein
MNSSNRNSRNQRIRQYNSRRNYLGGQPVCPENQRAFNNVCVETCPPGTYEEPDKLPLECSSDTWINRNATKVRVSVKKAARATVSAAKTVASKTSNAVKSAATATADFAKRQKNAAARKMYESCKAYVTNFEAALLSGKDVTQIVPPNPEQIEAEAEQMVVNAASEQTVVSNNEPVSVAQFRRSRNQNRRY